MKTIVVHNHQSLLDIAIQASGTVETVFELCGDCSITDDLVAGDLIQYDVLSKMENRVLENYLRKGYIPATALTEETVLPVVGGIDYMGIEIDFVVS
ncbi:MAG: hypothetical protein LC105_06190 [Chitinophagales bacterium]|nr:hypothetical protein [Chitinophagales bacterium]